MLIMVQRKDCRTSKTSTDSQPGEHQEGFLEVSSLVGLEGGAGREGEVGLFPGKLARGQG